MQLVLVKERLGCVENAKKVTRNTSNKHRFIRRLDIVICDRRFPSNNVNCAFSRYDIMEGDEYNN